MSYPGYLESSYDEATNVVTFSGRKASESDFEINVSSDELDKCLDYKALKTEPVQN
jgi:hypothetical protein